jgi:aldehyde:ferredoxin oxidoreductase
MQALINWLSNCYLEGVLEEKDTGLPLSKIGSADFIKDLTKKIALREGFGDLLAKGLIKAAHELGPNAKEKLNGLILTRGNEGNDYDPRLVLTNALLYSTEQRRPINQVHELTHALWMWLNWTNGEEEAFLSFDDFRTVAENFWGGAVAADFSTYEGKALAAKKIQDRTHAKESLILCDFLWPIIWVRFAEDHTGDPAMESRVLSAITGKDIDADGLAEIGERIFNLQRAIFVRQGWGGRAGDKLMDYLFEIPLERVFFNPDCIVPGKGGRIISRKGEVVERGAFERMKSEYYELRGWNVQTGLPTGERLKDLQLTDVADDLNKRGLLG